MLSVTLSIISGISGQNLIENGQARGRIYIPCRIDRTVLLAVQELQTHLKAMTGVEMPLAWRDFTRSDAGIVLSVRSEDEWRGKESSQAFTIVETAGAQPRVKITGNSGLALLYGVYQYLNDQGIYWFEPGEVGVNIPGKSVLAVKEREFKGTPSFLYRCLDFTGWHSTIFDYSDREQYREKIHHEYDLWLLRNRLMFERSIHQGDYFDFNRIATPLGHVLCKMCKLDPKDLAAHPERFPLVTVNGKQERLVKGAQICFTNETNISNAINSAIEQYSKISDSAKDLDEACAVSMALADAYGICECANCSKVAGTGPYSKDRLVWSFMNRVASELNRKMPGRKIMIFAPYLEITRPPEDVKIEPNIVAVACRGMTWQAQLEDGKYYLGGKKYQENLNATQKAGAEMGCYDYILWQGTPQPLNILDAAKFYADKSFKRYHVEVMQRSEQIWPILWSLARFTWDSKQDPKQLLADFCTQYYGAENGAQVLEIMKQLDANSRKMHRIIYGGPADTAAMLPEQFIKGTREKLTEAMKRANGKELERLTRFKNSLEIQMRLAEAYRAYCRALNERTLENTNVFQQRVEEFNQFWNENKMIRFCDPGSYNLVKKFSTVDFLKLKPQKIELTQEALLEKIFAGTTVPHSISNLFILPEFWKIQLDINDDGLKQGWEKSEFKDQAWPLISCHDFFEKQGYKEVGGRFWYRLAFEAPSFPEGEKVILRIGSLDDEGEIYLNGKLVFNQQDIWMWDQSFAIDVTGELKQGQENVIAIRGYDAMGMGGLWRPCALYSDK